mmetsp:Transcript_30114/g.56270  ORF Transcript_30114/g.56270 Transcript_30114/m.56270 type:complete len:210 (+) Transcript_30114:293-922(+)
MFRLVVFNMHDDKKRKLYDAQSFIANDIAASNERAEALLLGIFLFVAILLLGTLELPDLSHELMKRLGHIYFRLGTRLKSMYSPLLSQFFNGFFRDYSFLQIALVGGNDHGSFYVPLQKADLVTHLMQSFNTLFRVYTAYKKEAFSLLDPFIDDTHVLDLSSSVCYVQSTSFAIHFQVRLVQIRNRGIVLILKISRGKAKSKARFSNAS